MSVRRFYKRDKRGRFARGSGGGPGRGNKGSNPRGKYTSGKNRKQGKLQRAVIKRRQNRARHARVIQGKTAQQNAVVRHKGKPGGKAPRKRMSQERKEQIKAGVGLAVVAAAHVYLNQPTAGQKAGRKAYKSAKARDKYMYGGGREKAFRNVKRARAAGHKVYKARNRRGPKIVFPTGASSALVRR